MGGSGWRPGRVRSRSVRHDARPVARARRPAPAGGSSPRGLTFRCSSVPCLLRSGNRSAVVKRSARASRPLR
jgi:hypothetical protein